MIKMRRRTYAAILTTAAIAVICAPCTYTTSVENVEINQNANLDKPILSTPKLNIFLSDVYNNSSFNIICILRNTRITPLLIDDVSLPLGTLDFEFTTAGGQTLHYTGGGGGKRDPRTIFVLPFGFYIKLIDITKHEFGSNQTQNYTFTEHPGEYQIKAIYRSQCFGVWQGQLESPIRTFIVNTNAAEQNPLNAHNNYRAGVHPCVTIG